MTILTAGGSFADAYLKKFEAETASIREMSKTKFLEKINGAETIINNAATIASTDLETYLNRNFDFTRYLIKSLQDNNADAHFVHLSSMSILNPKDDGIYDSVLNMTPYAYSKYLAESYCMKAELQHISFVRFSTLFYGDPKKDGLSKLINDAVTDRKVTIYNGGEAKRNFLPLEVAVRYVNKIASTKAIGKTIYNLAAPKPTSYLEIVNILKKHLPDIEIEDKSLDSTFPVLSDFSQDAINELGRIDFTLEDYIVEYIKRVSS
jgi:nucleoside-diphosphate-sugar epimerase